MRFEVDLPSGVSIAVEAPVGATIRSIKKQIEAIEGIKFVQQRLYLGYHELGDNENLLNYSVGWNSTLRLEIIRDMTAAPSREGVTFNTQASVSSARLSSREWQTEIDFCVDRIQIAMQKARICLHRNGELLKELALPEGWLKDYLTKLSGDITQMANQIPVSDEKWSNDTRAKLQTLDIRGIQQLVESYSRLIVMKPTAADEDCSYATNRCYMDNEAVNSAIAIDDVLCALNASMLEIARGCACHLTEAAALHDKFVRVISCGTGWEYCPDDLKEQLKVKIIQQEQLRQTCIDILEALPERSSQAVTQLASKRAELFRDALQNVEGSVSRMSLLKALVAALDMAGKQDQAEKAAEELRIAKGGSSRLNVIFDR